MRKALLLVLVLGMHAALAQPRPDDTLSAIVRLNAKASPNARSAATLGSERRGSGALVRPDYVLTIGYLVIEAEAIEVTSSEGRTFPAKLAAYDHASGFALLKLAASFGGTPLALGDSEALRESEPAMVLTAPSRDSASIVHVASRRSFSGSWEYLLDSAIFTYPPVAEWSGAPLIGAKGELLGIGSLIVPDVTGTGRQAPGNMFVPVELLKPILEELITRGRRMAPAQPWLGVNADEVRGRLFIGRLSPEGPGERAGLQENDLVLAVGEREVTTLADFYRGIWSLGAAGVEVPLKVLRGLQIREVRVRSIDRTQYFRPSRVD